MTVDPLTSASPIPLWESLYLDALAHVPLDERDALRGGRARLVVRVLAKSSGLRCTFLYRLSHTFRHRVPWIGEFLSGFLFWVGRHWYGVSIAGSARIGGGLVLPHPQGIVVGGDVCIGARAWIFQNVTIGGAPDKVGMPRIGDDGRIYAGAVVTGPVTIGEDVMVGANSLVAFDVPAHCKVRAAQSTVFTT